MGRFSSTLGKVWIGNGQPPELSSSGETIEDPRQDPPKPEFFGTLRKRRKTQPEAKKRPKRKPRPSPVQAADPEPQTVVIDLGSDDEMDIRHGTHDAESDDDAIFVDGETLWLNTSFKKGG